MSSILPRWYRSWNYDHLTKDEPLMEKPYEDGEHPQVSHSRTERWWTSKTFLCISNLIFAGLSLSLYLTLIRQRSPSAHLGSFERGYTTEIAAARSVISIESKMFYGTPTWTKDGVGTLISDPNDRRYVGKADDQLDDNWEDLIGGRYFEMTEQEARDAWGPNYEQYKEHGDGGYVGGLDVLHLLHCLNAIRQDFHLERYTDTKHKHHEKVDPLLHRDHCFDAIRQSLMCHADLTPIPSRWFEGIGQSYIDTNRPHVCRNWNQIRAWASSRYNGSLAVKPPPHVSSTLVN